MKPTLFFFLALLIVMSCNEKEPNTPKTEPEKRSKDTLVKYNATLARKLGADEYGMKRYVMAFLKAGKTKIKDSTARALLQKKHLENINKLAEAGKLIVAGPFLDNQAIRGIFIFNVESVAEAQKLTATDPAIQASTLEMELHPWYGSAALIESLAIHKTLEKKGITEAK
jgi:uncharacterized protein YciI